MLEVRKLAKHFSGVVAVEDVSFSIAPGEILGYLGPNGAGKSTTVKMLTGLLEPSHGEILFQGVNVVQDMKAYQRRIGYVAEEAHLYPHLTGREYLQLAGRLRGIRRNVLEPKIDELLRLFGLWEDRYSCGRRSCCPPRSSTIRNCSFSTSPSPDWTSTPRWSCGRCCTPWRHAERWSSTAHTCSKWSRRSLLPS
jgi:ABC-type glutathione transport system ATPase component